MSGMLTRNRVVKGFGYAAFAVIVALIFSGCGGGGSSSGGGGGVPVGTGTGTGPGTGTGTGPGTGTGTGGGSYGSYQDDTDKWHIDFDPNALAAALATAGIAPGDSDEVRRLTIQYLEQYYSGTAISFSTAPLDPGSCPAPGDQVSVGQLGPNPYNVIGIWAPSGESGTGRAYQDISNTNERVENNSTYSVGLGHNLGVFINVYASIFAQGMTQGPDQFARFLAATTAHEIAHSLGLGHDDGSVHMMNPVSLMTPAAMPSFRSADVSALSTIMPGPGRD